MDRAQACPCCGHTELGSLPAVVAPFIADYVFGRAPWATALLECRACGFRFFEGRFSREEEARLYAGYRKEAYFQSRHRFEWWYTRRANEAIGADPEEIGFRKERLARTLAAAPEAAAIRSVLDYGGDRGQFIPDGVGQERYVLDISAAEPVAGVTALKDAAGLGPGRTVDLVVLSHVLEHAAQPAGLLGQAGALLGPGGLIYVEVPLERYNLRWLPRGAWYGRYVGALARHPFWLGWVDFLTTVFRIKTGVVPPLGVLKAHEHINFFNQRSLERLLADQGFSVISAGLLQNHPGSVFHTSLFGLARKG